MRKLSKPGNDFWIRFGAYPRRLALEPQRGLAEFQGSFRALEYALKALCWRGFGILRRWRKSRQDPKTAAMNRFRSSAQSAKAGGARSVKLRNDPIWSSQKRRWLFLPANIGQKVCERFSSGSN
jgi:hypothetical protein